MLGLGIGLVLSRHILYLRGVYCRDTPNLATGRCVIIPLGEVSQKTFIFKTFPLEKMERVPSTYIHSSFQKAEMRWKESLVKSLSKIVMQIIG